MTNKLYGILFPLLIFSQVLGQELFSELIKKLPSNLEPGSKNTVVFRFINNSEKDITLIAMVKSPANWRSFYNNTVLVNSKSTAILPIAVIVPLNTDPGFYELELVVSNSDINYQQSIKFDTHILKQIEFDISVVNAPKIAMAGKDILTDFSIYNRSNTKRRIFLTSTSGTINGAKSLTLDIGETKVVNVYYPTNTDLNHTVNYLIDLMVTSGPYQKAEKYYVTLIPSNKYKSDKYHRLPSEISLMYLHRNYGNYSHDGLQGHFYARGSLSPERDNYIEIRARGPDQFDNSILGLYDEYYLRYNSKKTNILIGDDSFELTPLTEYGRYGTGIRAEYIDKHNTLGFFYMQPRFFPDYKEEVAAYYRHNFDEANSVGFSYLQKDLTESAVPINLYSAQYSINPFKDLIMDAEYSVGTEDDDIGHGYSIELTNQTEKTFASIQMIDANSTFPGYYKNTRYLNGNLQYVFNDRLRFFANFHEDEINAERDTLFGVAPYSKYLIGGLTLNFRKSDYLNIYIGDRERKDRMPLQKFHYEENFSRLSLVNYFYNFQSNINYETGHTKNLLTDSEGQSYKSTFTLRFKPSYRLNMSAMLQYFNTFRYSADRAEEIIYGADATYNFKKDATINVSFQNSHNIEEYYRDRSLFDLKLSKTFKDQHKVEFSWSEALKQKQVDNRDTYIGLKYTLHFGIPVKKTKDLGHLRGRLLNRGVKKISSVVVNFGGRIQVTDEDGLFVFHDIPHGEHYLYIDNASLDLNDIAIQKMPMKITIEPDKLTDIQIGMTRATSLSGTVKLIFDDLHTEKLTKVSEDITNKNVIVELKLEDEYHRQIVNLNDNFIFMGLRPGQWTLKVYHNSLGSNYTIKNSEMIINLEGGESSSVNIEIKKKARRIRFQPTEIIVN